MKLKVLWSIITWTIIDAKSRSDSPSSIVESSLYTLSASKSTQSRRIIKAPCLERLKVNQKIWHISAIRYSKEIAYQLERGGRKLTSPKENYQHGNYSPRKQQVDGSVVNLWLCMREPQEPIAPPGVQ